MSRLSREQLRPFLATDRNTEEAVRAILRNIGTKEMGWLHQEVDELLYRNQTTIVGVEASERVIAGAIIAHGERPFPSELFDPTWAVVGERPVDVSIVGIVQEARRKANAGFQAALDALVKAIYWGCREWDFTDIIALMQPDRILVFNVAASIVLTVETPGQHRWCRKEVHNNECPLTYGVSMNRTIAEESWRINHFSFYNYVMTPLS